MFFVIGLGLAAFAGFGLQKLLALQSDWGRTALALGGAAITLILFCITFSADGITLAAAAMLSPLIFAFLVVPSVIGVHLAGKPDRSK